ncbi:MAG: ATP-binding protein [Desulfovibrio sp.]
MDHFEHPSIVELLDHLYAYDESERIEVKEGSKIGKSILETVIAFANEPDLNGGYLILGVAEDSNTANGYRIVGVTDLDRLKNDLSTQCRSSLNTSVQLRSWTEKVEGKVVLAFYINEADPGVKPVYKKATGLPKGAFRRGPSGDYRCTDAELDQLFAQKKRTEYDATVLPDADLDDIDPDAITLYRNDRERINPNAEELGWSDEELLRALSGVKKVQGELKPTVAGILLFGKQSALRRLLPAVRVDYIRISGTEWIEDPHERFDTLDMRDSLLRLIRRSISAVMDDLPKSFNLPKDKHARVDTPVLPSAVVRESIVNAIMHRNYQTHQPVQIIRYANRLEVRNPGYSLKPLAQLGEPGSVHRNPTISAVLHETNYAETKGSGVKVMCRLMEEAGLEPPQFESDRHRDLFLASYLFHHFLSEEDIEWLSMFKEYNLNPNEMKGLVFAREKGRITNRDYRDINRVDLVLASKDLCRLRDLNVLTSYGHGRATYYELSGVSDNLSRSQRSLLDIASKSGELEAKSGEFKLKSSELDVESSEFETKSSELDIRKDSLHFKHDKLKVDLNDMIEAVEAILGKTRNDESEVEPNVHLKSFNDLRKDLLPAGVTKEALVDMSREEYAKLIVQNFLENVKKPLRGKALKSAIYLLCSDCYLTAPEISRALQKNSSYLKQAYLSPMVKDGRLELLHSEITNHPKQAYRSVFSEREECTD